VLKRPDPGDRTSLRRQGGGDWRRCWPRAARACPSSGSAGPARVVLHVRRAAVWIPIFCYRHYYTL